MEKYICIHGHFYQPPRENAWLEVIEVQDSAHPYHDWNERISAECYAPNTAARILNDKSVITNIVNNYARISFNFGPTLLSWMEVHDKETYYSILEADKESLKHFGGHGSALAQVYNHMILPLANDRDKETQVIWGIRDFEYRFNRKPEGMWLAETAVDIASLEMLAKHDIKFTILAPRQARAFRKKGEETWNTISTDSIDTSIPYLFNLPSGRTITLFFYNGNISQGVAFDGLLYDGRKFADRILSAFDPNQKRPQLVHIATDGETYGHHHKHGDMALAFCLNYIERLPNTFLTNYGQYLEKFPPSMEVLIHENSSWSCVHGVERWRSDCGCNTGGRPPSWNQKWRKPLREALDWLRDEVNVIYEREAAAFLKDPWKAREDYINVILRRTDEAVKKFVRDQCAKPVEINRVFRLMEIQRNAMLMYTSCGWFFDEVSGIETTQIMQYACRAMQLVAQVTTTHLEDEFLQRLESAPSNIPSMENAKQIYLKYVLPSKTNLERVAMHYAVASIFEEHPEAFPVFNYSTHNDIFIRKVAGEQKLVMGIIKVKSNVTLTEKRFAFAVVYMGLHNLIGSISPTMDDDVFMSMQLRMIKAFEEGRLEDVLDLMQIYFGQEKYTIWELFQDEKRKVFQLITMQSMLDLENSLRRIYNRDYPLLNALANNDTPIPNAYRTTFEYILNADLIRCFQSDRINIREVERIMGELAKWKFEIEDSGKLERMAGESIYKELRRIHAEGSRSKRLEKLNRLLPLLKKFRISPNLHKSQNLYFEISRSLVQNDGFAPEWYKEFNLLGENLSVRVRMD